MKRLSRYRFCQAVLNDANRLFLTDPEPFRFIDLPDNRQHIAKHGDTWWGLAARYYAADGLVDNPTDLWSIIADFQPEPVVDPTLRIEPGRTIHIPSIETIFQRVLSEARRVEYK